MEERNEPISRQQYRQTGVGNGVKLLLAAAILGGAGYAWWHFTQKNDVAPPVGNVAAPVPAPEPEAPAAVSAPAVEPEPDHPLEPIPDPEGQPILAAEDAAGLESAVTQWLGKERSLKFVATDALAQRVVATIDNLPRKMAAVRLWPLHPVGGRMSIDKTDDGGMTISATNASRYDAVVGFITGMDAVQVANFYRRVYPVLQQAYEELGYPGKQFNTRLVATIDHLLQTPEPAAPLALKQVQVQGEVASQYPWLRYEFADADLQALSAGQKILVRMGVEHTRKIKVQLRALRAQITKS